MRCGDVDHLTAQKLPMQPCRRLAGWCAAALDSPTDDAVLLTPMQPDLRSLSPIAPSPGTGAIGSRFGRAATGTTTITTLTISPVRPVVFA